MASQEYANSYGKACNKYDKDKQNKQIEINRKKIKTK